tara:strand:+ start:29 stop:307 length:279 start_codon:yes stop_codon:yes gene_type:complete
VEGGSTMSHALQGEINYIVEVLEEHPFGDDVEVEISGTHARLVYVKKFNEWIFMDYKSDKFINDCELKDILSQLSDVFIEELHNVVLKEYAL